MEGTGRCMVLHYHGICRNGVRKTTETSLRITSVPTDIQTVASRFGPAVRRHTAWTGITGVACVIKHCPQTRGWSLLGTRQMPMRKFRFERRNAAIHPKNKHSHSSQAHCALIEMLDAFSLLVPVEQSVAPTSSPIVPTIASTHRTTPDMPTTWQWPARGLWCLY